MEDLFDEQRKFKIDDECGCCCEDEECDCEHDHECDCEDEEDLQDGYHVIYCRGMLFDAVKIFDYAASKEPIHAKTFALYNNYAADLKKNCISDEEPVIFIEFTPDAIDYFDVRDTDYKNRGYVLLTGAEKIKKAQEIGQETVDMVLLKAEEFFPFILFGQEDFAFQWNEGIDQRLYEKDMYENTKREQELSGE